MVSYQDRASSRMAKPRNSRVLPERWQRRATFAELVCAYEYGRLDCFCMGLPHCTDFLWTNHGRKDKGPEREQEGKAHLVGGG